MPALDVLAYAKLNLSLDVLEKRPDGYHEMRMVMQTVDLCDRLRLETGTGKPLSMRSNLGFLPADGRNLAAAAALRLAEETGMDWGGLSSGQPRPRRTLWLAGMTAVLTAVALAGEWRWGEALLLLAQLVTSFVALNRLPVHLEHPTWATRVSVPEPERQWRDEEEEEELPGEDPEREIQEEQSHE